MKVLITGSRHWRNEAQIRQFLSELKAKNRSLEVAHGKSKGGGVDLMVEKACNDLGIPQTPFPVLPRDGNHRGAPLNRNKRMVLSFLPDLVVGFRAEGKSNGTDQCISCAESLGYRTQTVKEEAA